MWFKIMKPAFRPIRESTCVTVTDVYCCAASVVSLTKVDGCLGSTRMHRNVRLPPDTYSTFAAGCGW